MSHRHGAMRPEPDRPGAATVEHCGACGFDTARLPDGSCPVCVHEARREAQRERERVSARNARKRLGLAPYATSLAHGCYALQAAAERLSAAIRYAGTPEQADAARAALEHVQAARQAVG